ncbi:MAG: class I SAM-dependent methyltransferase [Pseudonocardiaceae bacterium]
MSARAPVPCDYDARPGRMRLAREVLRRHGARADVHAAVASRFVAEKMLPVLDVGCGEGELARHLPAGAWVGVDSSPAMVAGAPAGARLGEAVSLPFESGSFGGVALLCVLYHLEDPAGALAEARRVGREGALVAVAAPSRHDSPELAFALPRRSLTFDADQAPGLMAEHLADVEVDRWNLPLLTLPDRDAVRDYLIGKGADASSAAAAAAKVKLPLAVTKRGALVWGTIRG